MLYDLTPPTTIHTPQFSVVSVNSHDDLEGEGIMCSNYCYSVVIIESMW